MKRSVIGMGLMAIALLPSLCFAGTESISCTESISGTVNTNVVVPTGAQCVFTPNATINGNVSVGSGATLLVVQGVIINKNLEAATDSLVLMGPGSTLNGRYSASGATTAILESNLAQNADFSGGSYAILGNVVGNLSCGGDAVGAILTTIGILNSGCTIGTLETVLSDLGTAADKASGGSSSSPSNCDALLGEGLFYTSLADLANPVCQSGVNSFCDIALANLQKAGFAFRLYNSTCSSPIG